MGCDRWNSPHLGADNGARMVGLDICDMQRRGEIKLRVNENPVAPNHEETNSLSKKVDGKGTEKAWSWLALDCIYIYLKDPKSWLMEYHSLDPTFYVSSRLYLR